MARSVIRALAAALAAFAPIVAAAQPVSGVSGPDTYLQLRIGAFLPQASDVQDIDAGFELGGRFGARFTPNVAVEVGVAYYRAEGKMGGASAWLSNLPLTAGLRLRAPLGAAEISAFGAAGLAIASISADAGVLGEVSDTATAFGYDAGAELAFKLSPMMRVGAEVRWTFAEPRFDGGRVSIDGLHVAFTYGYEF